MAPYRSLNRRMDLLERKAGLHEKRSATILLEAWEAASGEVERKQQAYLAEHGLTREDIGTWILIRGLCGADIKPPGAS